MLERIEAETREKHLLVRVLRVRSRNFRHWLGRQVRARLSRLAGRNS